MWVFCILVKKTVNQKPDWGRIMRTLLHFYGLKSAICEGMNKRLAIINSSFWDIAEVWIQTLFCGHNFNFKILLQALETFISTNLYVRH